MAFVARAAAAATAAARCRSSSTQKRHRPQYVFFFLPSAAVMSTVHCFLPPTISDEFSTVQQFCNRWATISGPHTTPLQKSYGTFCVIVVVQWWHRCRSFFQFQLTCHWFPSPKRAQRRGWRCLTTLFRTAALRLHPTAQFFGGGGGSHSEGGGVAYNALHVLSLTARLRKMCSIG